jgi:Family of unknown function (DUF6348)
LTLASHQTCAIALAMTVVVASAFVFASNRPPNLSERCVQALVSLSKSTDSTVTSSGDRLWIGGKEVRLTAQIENDERADAKYLVGLRVDVLVGGVSQPFTAGSIGLGNNEDDAVETAIHEWSQFVGRALLGSLGVKAGVLPQSVGPFLVYSGLAGIRGSGVVWSAEKDRQLLHHLDTIIQGLENSPKEFHSILLMVAVRHAGTTEGECRLDGAISPAVLAAVQSFPWSQSGMTFLFKQFYILRRR